MVKKEAHDKKVLNLFCYTASFSVYAASGGASEVHSVDLSKTYLQWAEENMRLNKFTDSKRYKYFHADVLQFLNDVKANSFDLVILDPPTFSNSKRMKDFLDIQRDHVMLINQCLNCITQQGVVFFSTNFSRFILDTNALHASFIRDITKQTTPFDFEGKLKRWCYRIAK